MISIPYSAWGAPVVTEASGKSPRLICKYHAWTYSLDGSLQGYRNPEDFAGLDKSCRGLRAVRCERFGNLIFVNFDDEAPSLLEWLGPIAEEWREFQFDRCRLTDRHIFDLNCNWKIAMEANTEVYHVPVIHPKTVASTIDVTSTRSIRTATVARSPPATKAVRSPARTLSSARRSRNQSSPMASWASP